MKRNLSFLLVLALAAPAVLPALAQAGGYDLSWWTVDGGGASEYLGHGYALSVTIGQPDAAGWSGEGYTLSGGFWGGPVAASLWIPARVELRPDPLNLAESGRPEIALVLWLTAYVELPGDYDVNAIDLSTVELAYSGTAVHAQRTGSEVWDYDRDGIPDRSFRFSLSAVGRMLAGLNQEVELTLTGQMMDGTPFNGEDVLRVITRTKP